MKILTLCNVPADAALGSGYGILNYAAQLRRLGHAVELHDAGAAILFPGLRKGRGYRLALGMLLLALRRVREEPWDVVEFWGAEAWLAISVLARRPRRDFLIVHHSNGIEPHAFAVMKAATGYANFEGRPPRWFQLQGSQTGLLERAFTRCDALVTLAGFDRAYALEKNYLPPDRVLAIDTPLAPPFVGLVPPPKPGKRLGFGGMWSRRKGADALAATVPRLLREFPEWTFRIIGPGSDPLPDFPADVRDRIEVVPFLRDREALRRAYEEIDIFLVPSLYESFGVVAIEAMAAGCALVMNRTGIGAALRHREEAWILPHVSAELLYEGVRSLMADPALRSALQQAGSRRAQASTWEAAGATLAAHYQRWLGEIRAR